MVFVMTCLPGVERAHARKLVKIGTWEEANEGEILIKQGSTPDRLKFIVRGEAAVERDGQTIGTLGQGDFLGEMSFLTMEKATATVAATNLVQFISFERNRLRSHLEKHPEVKQALEASFNRNLVTKLAKTSSRQTTEVSAEATMVARAGDSQ